MDLEKQFAKAQEQRDNGQIKEAVADYQLIMDEALQSSDRRLAAMCLHMIGVALKQDGQYPEAGKILKDAEKEFGELGDQDLVAAVLRDRGDVALHQKDYVKAKELVEQSISLLSASQRIGHLGISKAKLGLVLAAEGKLAEAEAIIKEGLDDIKKSPDRFFELSAYLYLAEVQRQAGKKEEAKQSLYLAKGLLDEIGAPEQFLVRRKQVDDLLKKLEF